MDWGGGGDFASNSNGTQPHRERTTAVKPWNAVKAKGKLHPAIVRQENQRLGEYDTFTSSNCTIKTKGHI